MGKLVWRMLRKTAVVSLAVAALFATSLVILMVYNAFVEQASNSFAGSMTARTPEGHLFVKLPFSMQHRHVGPAALLVLAWKEQAIETNLGVMPAAIFTNIGGISRALPQDSVLVHPYIAKRYELNDGDIVSTTIAGKEHSLKVEAIYTDFSLTEGYDFGERLLIYTGEPQESDFLLYQHVGGSFAQAKNQVGAAYGKAYVKDRADELAVGSTGVERRLSALTQAKISLIGFIAIAYLTAKMMAFLENRRVMAILKATGLKNREVGLYMGLEAVLAPLVGTAAALAVGWQLLMYLERQGAGLAFSLGLYGRSALSLLPAVLVGVLVPSRFGHVASVNELALERSIPMFREKVDALKRRYPQLDPLIHQGIHFVRLEVVEGQFEGFIFRQVGDLVRKNEVLATATGWWGLKVTDYVAPVSGRVVFFDGATGLMGVHPDEGYVDSIPQAAPTV